MDVMDALDDESIFESELLSASLASSPNVPSPIRQAMNSKKSHIPRSNSQQLFQERMSHIKIISGSSHPDLALAIAGHLGMTPIDCTLDKFSNSEIRVQIDQNIRRNDVVIIQTGAFSPETGYSVNDFFVELALIIDACRRSSVRRITLVSPLFFYARQDKKDKPRCPISGRAIASIIENMGVNRVVTLDLHASQIAGFFNIPVDNLYIVGVMARYLETHYSQQELDNFVLVSPDAGGVKRLYGLAEKTKLPTVIMHKERSYDEKNLVKKTILIGSQDCVKNKSCIIVDDMCDTAGTICQASQTLLMHGAKDIRVLVTHGILSGPALERLAAQEEIVEVLVTNSVPQELNQKRLSKIRVIDISELLAETIRRLFTGESISALFE